MVAEWRAEATRASGRPVHSTVLGGNPASEIVGYVRERGFDLLVLATHGRTGLARFVLGSVAERVVREATCPVLVVRGSTPLEPGSGQGPGERP